MALHLTVHLTMYPKSTLGPVPEFAQHLDLGLHLGLYLGLDLHLGLDLNVGMNIDLDASLGLPPRRERRCEYEYGCGCECRRPRLLRRDRRYHAVVTLICLWII